MIYDLTLKLPEYEKFGLSNQMRRAAVSITANISEGASRRSTKEYVRYLEIAIGSAAELLSFFELIQDRSWVKDEEIPVALLHDVKKMLLGLQRSLLRANQ